MTSSRSSRVGLSVERRRDLLARDRARSAAGTSPRRLEVDRFRAIESLRFSDRRTTST